MNTPNSTIKTASSSLPVGTRLAEFEITGVIGEGGFGIVYNAHDSSLERIVAVKEYLPSAFAQRGSDGTVQVKSEEHRKTFAAGLSSFINEARMLAKFSHPGLVEVFRFWEANGTAYMAMRYYRGVTLRETLRSSREMITEQWLCETLDPIMLALKELHNERCFHRDIAPDNILVLPNGKSVLMDFGAARRIISGMTQALTTVLKPGYAPIEQYYDDGSMPQGAWTDIYAIGGLLYHLMTGKVPVQAISRMMSDPLKPVVELSNGAFSERLCNVVMKCLAVLPENRYQSIDELRAALGWVTLPVVSTVLHQPAVKRVGESDFQETVLMAPVSQELRSLTPGGVGSPTQHVAVNTSGHDASGHDAILTSHASQLVGEGAASIDDLLASPEPVRQSNLSTGVSAPDPLAPPTKLAVVLKKTSAGVWGAVVAGFVVLVVAGLYMAGVFRSEVPESQPIVQAAPPAVEPLQPVPRLPEAVVASESNVGGVVPVEVAVPASPVASDAVLSVTAAASEPAEPKPGSVRVELVGGWGNVIVDGELKGTVPPVLFIKLPAGSHDIEIQNPAAATVKRKVTVQSGKTVLIRHIFAK
jgi:non-specific serine/threonine protein kinase